MTEINSVESIFGSNVFSDEAMRVCLPKNIYKSFQKVLAGEISLEPAVADVIANSMKDWAVAKGATHYCHWFQPMTGMTAEKHDSFISPTGKGGVLVEFSGKELIQGEPDASSFPSGGLRATFEARGYTAWDVTSPAFIKEDGSNITLYIPCAFCSYTEHALDKKTPLLRSMEALNKQAMRVLKVLGNKTSTRVTSTQGAEQEYFLVDRDFVNERLDLQLAGRTLLGAPSPRGQEMDDHYFGSLHERVASFMNELNIELWKLGVSAKTQHNEVSPAQYEIAPIFATVNVATDHNQLTMETLQKVALRHDFVCLLHEKPFAGVNGSGKHNNWSMSTDDGINLLDPGSTPHDNMVFLVMLCAIVRAVDKNAALLRSTVANSGNEHRLGANEAPPAIVSVFLGDQLTDIFEQLAAGQAKSSHTGGELKLGVSTLPKLPKDSTDRNRTSPFAFTGNRFEFRMVGSSQSTSGPSFAINTIVADSLMEIADELEKGGDVQAVLTKIAKKHGRVVFNGDNYTEAWVKKAAKRGLPNMRSTSEALQSIPSKENEALFTRHAVLSTQELQARTEILLESYNMVINIEARTTLHMVKRQVMPAVAEYCGRLAGSIQAIEAVDTETTVDMLTKMVYDVDEADTQRATLVEAAALSKELGKAVVALEAVTDTTEAIECVGKRADSCRDEVIPAMNAVRAASDALEIIVDDQLWPLPTYAEMLFMR